MSTATTAIAESLEQDACNFKCATKVLEQEPQVSTASFCDHKPLDTGDTRSHAFVSLFFAIDESHTDHARPVRQICSIHGSQHNRMPRHWTEDGTRTRIWSQQGVTEGYFGAVLVHTVVRHPLY